MPKTTAILSTLHEPAGNGSVDRRFRGRPVLQWTLDRLSRARQIEHILLLCWDDQNPSSLIADPKGSISVISKGLRTPCPEIDALTASRRWADGWRGGLLATCDFDAGFHGQWMLEAARSVQSDAIVLIDPSAGLIDPNLLDALVTHATDHPDAEIAFCPAAPGLAGALLRLPLLERLATGKTHPGRLMHYHPDQISREPLAGEGCVPIPAPLARTSQRFTLDSDRQINRLTQALEPLNGELISSGAEALLNATTAFARANEFPREVVLELTPRRNTRPFYWPGQFCDIQREDFSLENAKTLFNELGEIDDIRLTLAGVGDPLLHGQFFELVDLAVDSGIRAIHVETDLFGVDASTIARLARSPIDVISIHLPGLAQETYEAIMGVTGYTGVLENIRTFVTERLVSGRGRLPILVPTFVKCRQNLGEMEAWYDQWLRAVGSAVIRSPSAYGGIVPLTDLSVAEMAPPKRKPCARIASRLTVLSDGRIVSCEEDVCGRQPLGRIGERSVGEVWRSTGEDLRQLHQMGQWSEKPLCAGCAEWHRL